MDPSTKVPVSAAPRLAQQPCLQVLTARFPSHQRQGQLTQKSSLQTLFALQSGMGRTRCRLPVLSFRDSCCNAVHSGSLMCR